MSTSALRAANTIIEQSLENGQMVDQLKLQKLLYLAQGISLAVRDEPLFSDKIEAWRYGPVVRAVYNAAKFHGAAPIAALLPGIYLGAKTVGAEDTESIAVIAETLRAYGDLQGVQLVALTHRPGLPEGEPWVEARARATPRDQSPTIDLDLMRTSFKRLLKQQPIAY